MLKNMLKCTSFSQGYCHLLRESNEIIEQLMHKSMVIHFYGWILTSEEIIHASF